jgi:hypothetical protein
MTLTAKDLKAYADGVRYQINRCKAICRDFCRVLFVSFSAKREAKSAALLSYRLKAVEHIRLAIADYSAPRSHQQGYCC